MAMYDYFLLRIRRDGTPPTIEYCGKILVTHVQAAIIVPLLIFFPGIIVT